MSTETDAAKPRYEINIGYLENVTDWDVHEITRLAGFEASWSQAAIHSSESLIEGYDYGGNEFEIHFSPEMVAVEYDGTSREFGVGSSVFDLCIRLGIYQPIAAEPHAVKPPLTLADLSEEQAIQIAKMAYGNASFEFVKADTGNGGMVVVQFLGQLTTEGKVEWMAGIYPDFSVWLRYKLGGWQDVHATSQRAIQKLFTQWGAE